MKLVYSSSLIEPCPGGGKAFHDEIRSQRASGYVPSGRAKPGARGGLRRRKDECDARSSQLLASAVDRTAFVGTNYALIIQIAFQTGECLPLGSRGGVLQTDNEYSPSQWQLSAFVVSRHTFLDRAVGGVGVQQRLMSGYDKPIAGHGW